MMQPKLPRKITQIAMSGPVVVALTNAGEILCYNGIEDDPHWFQLPKLPDPSIEEPLK